MTAGKIVFHPDAIEEAEAAARWYRNRSLRAAARFVEEVNQVIEKIVAAPQRWPLGVGGARKIKLPCYPFIVVYRESDDTLQVLAVAHCRRRPGYWKDRL